LSSPLVTPIVHINTIIVLQCVAR